MSTTAHPAVAYGTENLTVPQVDAAICVLTQACKPLAAFRGRRCIGNGAYLDPAHPHQPGRSDLPVGSRPAPAKHVRAKERELNARILADWADPFQAEGWSVDGYLETDHYDTYRLVRLRLTLPADAVPGRRVLTSLEHHAARHAIESSAGEEGADPAAILSAVLHALNISAPPRE
ncbi:hypothetical protein [Streptomyces solaniscabiei]|uniref:hypothetical protein n=1 Tax=Streptomyces solaniscabiei TaxID=2683255 RepID=UPI001CE34224|nr:hypothetical protein [Streptomyces solaniscabiei]